METERTGPTLLTKAVALIVLLVAAWIVLRMVIGVVAGIAWVVVLVAAVIGVVWAWRTLRS
jgi:hypothetical protein